MNTPSKKSYSKKPSKKERLAAELAQKKAAASQAERLAAGGVFIRADGVAVSQVALAARQAALASARNDDDPPQPLPVHASSSKKVRPQTRHAVNTLDKIEAPMAVGKRLAHCLWAAQVLLIEVLPFTMAADKQVSQFLRAHKELGARDRAIVAETVYTVLRQKRVFSHLAQSGQGALERRLVVLAAYAVVDADKLVQALPAEEFAWVKEVSHSPINHLPMAVQSNLPDAWWQALAQAYGEDTALTLAQALNQTAPLDVRINTERATAAQVHAALELAGVAYQPCAYAPLGLRLPTKPALQKLEIFNAGGIEVQDEGSQLLTHLVGAKRGEMVADFCAGAGGKTLALGAMMRNTGRLYAFDIAAHRLAKLKPRLARSGLSNVTSIAIDSENDIRVKRLAGKFDRVLVDAPCSGLGTLRRNPDLKWRHSIDSVARLTATQASILHSAARLVKAGGVLVYATCSVLPAENQDIIQAFLTQHPEFHLVNPQDLLRKAQIDIPADAVRNDCLQLLPHLHQTDGFFAAYLQRKAATAPANNDADTATVE